MARSKPPTAKTATGFEYPVHRLSELLEKAQEEKLAAYRDALVALVRLRK